MNEKSKVATVCDCQCRIYGPVQLNGRRPLTAIYDFPTRGAALVFAVEFDDTQKRANRQERG